MKDQALKKHEAKAVSPSELSCDLAIPQSTMHSIQSLVMQMLMNIHCAPQNGTVQQYEALGMSSQQIWLTAEMTCAAMDELARSHARTIARRSLTDGGITCTYYELGDLIARRSTEEELAEQYLRAEASNDLMYRLFGKRSTECTRLRQQLNIRTKKGRKSDPKDGSASHLLIHDLYKQGLKQTPCKRQALLHIHRKTGYPINYIHRVVTDYDTYPL